MKHAVFLLLSIGCAPCLGWTQGLIFDPVSLSEFPIKPLIEGPKNSSENLPLKKDLSEFVPPIITQGKQDQTCTAIATAYYAIGMQRAIERSVKNTQQIRAEFSLSPLYVFSKVKNTAGKCSEGTKLAQVAHYLKDFGSIPFSAFDATTCADTRLSGLTDTIQAPVTRVQQVQVLFLRDSSTALSRRLRIKESIHQNCPVVVGLELFTNFAGISKQDPFYHPSSGKPIIITLPGKRRAMAGHAVTVVGFDDDINAFKMVNSYGASWGIEGFFWMKYSDFEAHAREAIILQLFP